MMSIHPALARVCAFGFGLGTLALFASGCGAKASSSIGDAKEISSELEADDGGMNAADEPVEFGDSAVAAVPELTNDQIDPTDMTAAVAATAGATRYHVALLWGHLPAPEDASDADVDPQPVDWTGSISVDAGAIGVKKTLAFDARDHVDPRTDPKTVSFTSHTLPFVDGLFVHVVVPAGASPTLHVDTTALKTDLDLSALRASDGGVTRLGDGRNGLAWVGYPDVAGCARGLVFGRWVKVRAALGRFHGRVIDGDGERIGDVRGIWGHAARRNDDLFFGKYISTDGTHRGLFGGTYGDGDFHGLWGTRDPRNVGVLEGHYSDGYEKGDGRGVFLGRWSEKCE